MMHSSFEPDTLFLVFEEDWRITPGPALPPREAVPEDAPGFVVSGLRPVGRNYYIPTAGSYPSKQEHGTVVGDLVSIATKASRANHGDVVWMTWQPGQGEVARGSTKIRSGAMLIALSVRGAKTLAGAMEKIIKKDHFDLALLQFLKDEGNNFACYVYPPLGNDSSHVSGCEEDYAAAARPSCWTTKWVCPGTRRKDDPSKRDKWLAVPVHKGQAKWLTKYDLDKECESLEWKSNWSVPGVGRPDKRKDFKPPDVPTTELDEALSRVLRDVVPAATDCTLVFNSIISGEAVHIQSFGSWCTFHKISTFFAFTVHTLNHSGFFCCNPPPVCD